ncbi:hypothetical protein R4282_03410 [Rhodococcus oxybenzonivorans]|uniref:hypothetical protein n=1 Tax=Rhodococcus oxybenzonivorans TaxID=1990687 RepID=UPI002954E664|nr:hypothetical protein [Rhodococcus oxybenzonivorans]MDV7352068.1 hypothetical protein [Rhodococcus oxybenzonivorans]
MGHLRRFEQTSDVWRAASLQFNPPGEEFPPALDHQVIARNQLSAGEIEGDRVLHIEGEQVLQELRVLFGEHLGVDRPSGLERPAALAEADNLTDSLSSLMKDAYAARRLVVNRVQSENGNAPIDEPGQTLTGEVFDSERLLMLEAYFDDSHWGDRFFAQPEVSALVRSLLRIRDLDSPRHRANRA